MGQKAACSSDDVTMLAKRLLALEEDRRLILNLPIFLNIPWLLALRLLAANDKMSFLELSKGLDSQEATVRRYCRAMIDAGILLPDLQSSPVTVSLEPSMRQQLAGSLSRHFPNEASQD